MTEKINDGVPYTNSVHHEPSFFRKKKQEGHQLMRTHTTDTLVKDELPKNKALLYKAGYRRVQFDMPTEYRLQYGWPSDPSPLMKAATMTTEGDREKKEKDKERPSSRKVVTKGTRDCRHVINGAPVNGRTHTIITEPHPNDDKPVVTSNKSHLNKQQVKNMQETFEQRMDYTKENSVPNGVRATKKKQQKGQQTQPAHSGGSKKSREVITHTTTTTKGCKQRSRSVGKNKENKGKDKKTVAPNVDQGAVDNPVPSHYPLVSEYQSTFRNFSEDEKQFLKKQLKETNPGIGFKDHVKDIIYFTPPSHTPVKTPSHPPLTLTSTEQSSTPLTKLKPSTVITPHTYTSSWTTEYTSSFLSPLCMNYVNGVWQGAHASDDPPGSDATVDSVKGNPLSTASWFDQVLELRKKVKEYKYRGEEGSEPSLQVVDLEDHQSSRQRVPTSTPTLSVSSLEDTSSCDGSLSPPPRPIVPDTETSSCSSYQHRPTIDPTRTVCTCHKEQSESDGGLSHNYPPPPVNSLKTKLPLSDRLMPTYPVAPLAKPAPPKPAVLIYSNPKHNPPLKQRPSTVKPSLPLETTPLVSPYSRSMSPPVRSRPLPPRATPEVHRDDTCQTCGAVTPNRRDGEPSLRNDCRICHYHPNPLSSKAPPNPYPRTCVPVCPPSCPDSPGGVRKDDSFSLSPVSLSSSCSVASEILERAKKRQKHAWK